MISETGNKRPTGAFTLIEIVLVVGLIAIASSVVLVNFVAFTDRGETTDPSQILRRAVREARFQAAAGRANTTLRFDRDEARLTLLPGNTHFPLGDRFGPTSGGEIRFFLVPPASGLSPFPEAETARLETAEVVFAPDQSASPFVAEIDTGRGSPERLVFDPFSSIVRQGE